MKASTTLTVLAAAGAQAHYTFPGTKYNGVAQPQWDTVRITQNHYSNGPVTDVNSPLMTCYERDPGVGAPNTLAVTAGSTVTFQVGSSVGHPGPLHFYMAKVPAGKTAKTFDGKGAVWFKIYQDGPSGLGTGSIKWPSDGELFDASNSVKDRILTWLFSPNRQDRGLGPDPQLHRQRRVPPPC